MSEGTIADELSRHKVKLGIGCGTLFILPFIIAGIASLVAGIRDMRSGEGKNAFLGVVVGGLFLMVGLGMAYGLFHSIRKSKRSDVAKSRHPDQPWMWRTEWMGGQIRADAGAALWFIGFFALVWNAISWTVLVAAWEDIVEGGEKKAYFMFIFPVVGAVLLGWLIYSFWRHRKFGVSVFKMRSVPGVLGGTVQGHVEVPTQINPARGFNVRLVCVHRYTSGSGKNRSTREQVRWEEEKVIARDLHAHDSSRTGIPVFFNIPYDLPPSREGNPSDVWRLQVSAEVAGVDYHAQFEIPVFKTAESSENAAPVQDPTAQYQAHGGEYRWPTHSPIKLSDKGNQLDVHFPAARNKGVLFGLFLFLLIWNGAIWFMIEGKVPLLFPIVFGLFDLLLLMVFFSMLLCSARVLVTSTELKLLRRFFGFPMGSISLGPEEIKEVQLGSGMQSGDKNYYRIDVINQAGRKIKLAGGIRDKKQAEWLINKINARLGRWDGGDPGASIVL